MDEQLAELALPFLAALPRLAVIFLMLPFFGRRTTEGIIRAQFVIILAIFVYPSAAQSTAEIAPGFVPIALVALKEALIGAVIGFFLATIFWVALSVGYLIDLQTGTQNALIFDPVHDHEEGPTAAFMLRFVITLVLAGGGLLVILGVVFESYRIWPIHQTLPSLDRTFTDAITARADTLFAVTVQFAAPIIVLLLLIEVGLGLLNRVAESLDVYSLAMPIKSTVALLVLIVFTAFIHDAILAFISRDNEILLILERLSR